MSNHFNDYYDYDVEDDDDDETIPLKRANQGDTKLWDSFQDPPSSESTGSSVDSRALTISVKTLKVFTYILVFVVILSSGVISKISFLLMTSMVHENTKVKYCDSRRNRIF